MLTIPETLWVAVVWVVGIILAIRTTGPSSYRHRARHKARWWTPQERRSTFILMSTYTERRPRDEWGRWLIPIEGEPRDQG